jgi:hypothetical protein
MNRDIESRGIYLSTAEGDDVIGDEDAGGNATGGGGARSSMTGGERDWSS